MAIIINGSNTPTAGAVGVGNGTELAFTAAGTTNQLLQSAGSSTPTWSSDLSVSTVKVPDGLSLYPNIASASNTGTGIEFSNVTVTTRVGTNIGTVVKDTGFGVGCLGVGVTPDLASFIQINPGTFSTAAMRFEAGVDFNTPIGGNLEYNGEVFKISNDSTSGRGYLSSKQIYRLAANGAAIGPAISNFFGANSALRLEAAGEYEIVAYCFFTKTTAGTATFTLTSSAAPVNVSGILQTGAIAGGTAIGAANQAALFNSTSTAAAFGATGSLTTGVNHAVILRFMYEAHATTPPNIRINITQSAGTVTPLRNSYYTVSRLPAGNEGNYVA